MNITLASKTRKVLLTMIIFVVLVTIVSAVLAFSYFKNQKITSLSQRVDSVAVSLDTTVIHSLSGTEEDLNNSAYITIKDKLMRLQTSSTDTRFIYLMGKSGEELFFYADSEPATSEDYSPPGQVYDEASDVMRSVFTDGTVGAEISSDRWGTWLSVMSPVIDPATHTTIALVGFDMPYQTFIVEVMLFTLLPISIGVIVLILLIAAFIYAKKDEEIMQVRSEYFAIAAHDLRTPLTGIKWAMDYLRKSQPLIVDSKQKSLVNQIILSTENMLLSVNELLEGSSIEKSGGTTLILSAANISELLAAAYAPLDIIAKQKKLTTLLKVNKNLIIQGDNDKLRRVFANLLSNAVKYSQDKGTVTISAKKIATNIVITITDDGIGIPVNEQSKIFSGYYRASNAKEYTTQGTGLGLYYVKNIIQLHDGTISLDSAPGKGTTITISLPVRK